MEKQDESFFEQHTSKMEEAVKKFFEEPVYLKSSTTSTAGGIYNRIKSPTLMTTTTGTTGNITGVLNGYTTQNQLQDLHMIVLEQREQIDILTKAVEQLLEQKLETFKKHE